MYGRENLSFDDVKNALIQRDLIKKQLTKRLNQSNESLFLRRRMNDRCSCIGAKNRSRYKSKTSNKGKTCHIAS